MLHGIYTDISPRKIDWFRDLVSLTFNMNYVIMNILSHCCDILHANFISHQSSEDECRQLNESRIWSSHSRSLTRSHN